MTREEEAGALEPAVCERELTVVRSGEAGSRVSDHVVFSHSPRGISPFGPIDHTTRPTKGTGGCEPWRERCLCGPSLHPGRALPRYCHR